MLKIGWLIVAVALLGVMGYSSFAATSGGHERVASRRGQSPENPVYVKQVVSGGETDESAALLLGEAKSLNSIASVLAANEAAKKESDDKLVTLTAALAKYTFDLFIATLVLAVATLGLVLFGFRQSIDARESIEVARRSADVAERALTTVERPWVIIQAADLPPRFERGLGTPNAWMISLHLSNVGRSPAVIESVDMSIIDRDHMPENPDYSASFGVACDKTIASGNITKTQAIGPAPGAIKNGRPVQYVVYGRVMYADLVGTRHATGFAFDVSPDMPAYSSYNNKSFEYYT